MRCRHCGTELEAGELFCFRCGKAVEQKARKRCCAVCGVPLKEGAVFCTNCGTAVRGTSQAASSENRAGRKNAQDASADRDALRARTEKLVLAAQKGDSDSFAELYQLYYQKVFALAKTTVKSDADAEDVLQLTFIKAWNSLSRLKNTAAFSTWIQRITLNQCYSLLRKKHIDISIDDEDEDAEPIQLESELMLPETYAERSDLKARLGKIIRELSAVQQQTITLYYFDELPVEHIAWIMDCSVNTVKSRLFLARKSIKTEIEEQERKSGQPFYGVIGLATIPFGSLFLEQIQSSALPQATAAALFQTVSQRIAESAAGIAGKAATGAARTVAGTAAKGAAKVGVKTAAKAAAAAVSKKIIAGVVAGVLATGAVTGGTVAAVSIIQSHREEVAQTEDIANPEQNMQNEPAQTEDAANPGQNAQGEPAQTEAAANPGQNTPDEPNAADELFQQELQAAYRAYLDYLIANKEGIDNYTWQFRNVYTYYSVDESDRLIPLDEPYTDEKQMPQRHVVLYDVYGDSVPELIYIGDVSSPVTLSSVSILNILTYQNGEVVSLYSDAWDTPLEYVDFTSEHSLSVRPDGTLVYYHSEGATFDSTDHYEVFTLKEDGKLHREFALEYVFDSFEHDEVNENIPVVETYTGPGQVSISKEEYEAQLKIVAPQESIVLLGQSKDASLAMTCDEAIAYLKGLLNQSDATEAQTAENVPYADAYRAYRDHLIAHKADIDNYIWQFAGWELWYDVDIWEDYLVRNDKPIDETTPVSRPVVLYDIVGDSTPELIYICCNANAQINYYNPSHLVILTYRNGQLTTLLDCEWQHWASDSIPAFQIYASSLDAYKLQAHWSDGLTEWSKELHDVFTEAPDGTFFHTHLLCHEQSYDEDADQVIDVYRQGDLDISREFYDYFVEKWEETKGKLLLYSSNEPNTSYDAECGSMTCDEAISYLESLLP